MLPGSVWILVSDPPGLSSGLTAEQVVMSEAMMSHEVGVAVGVMEGAGLKTMVWF